MKNESCYYGGVEYSHGSTICSNGKELVCNNGDWEPTGKDCEENILKSRVVIISDKNETSIENLMTDCPGKKKVILI